MQQSSYISLTHTWIFMWAFILMLAFVIQPTQSAGTERELLSIIDAPDSKSFWDTGMRLCDIDEKGDCHSGNYALSILRYGSGGLAAAVVCVLFFVLFMPVRFLCNGFGGKNKSYGICPDMIDIRSYTKKEIIAIKVVAALVLIPIVIGVGIGFKANTDISNSVESITFSLVTSGNDILHTLEEARDVILSVSNNSAYARITVNNAITSATEITDRLNNVHDTTNKYDGVREGLMIAGAVCCIVLVVVGILAAIFNLRVIAMILGLFSILILAIIWLSFGAHLVAGKFAYDVCVDIDLLMSEDSNTTSIFKRGALANLWDCDNNTDLINLQSLINNSILDAASSACTLRAQICYSAVNNTGDPNWNCSTTPACGYNTLTNVTDEDHMTILDGGQSYSVAECAVNCTSSSYRNLSLAILSSVELYSNYTSLYYNGVLPIISCQVAIDVLTEVKGTLCGDLFDSVYGVAVSNLIVGIFYVPFIVTMIMGYKRFRSFKV